MKICDVVINSVWYDPRVRKQLAMYLEAGVDVVAVGQMCTRYDEEKVAAIPCKTRIADIDERYKGKQRGIFRKLKREYLSYCAVRDVILEEKPDLIHANDFNALLPAYAAARKLKCKIVYDSHEVWGENQWIKAAAKPFINRMDKFLARRVDQMVCVSHAAAEYFSQTYGIEKPMVVTNCAIKKEIVSADTVKKNAGFEVLNHGQFYAGRGYDVMADACSMLKDYPEIVLAVRGFGKMEEQLRETVAELENKEQFRFYPPVTVQELIPTAARSCVGVAITESICLNFKLSVSNKLFEYVAAGLPVIMSDIPEHRYLNDKYDFGIVLQENTPEAFAKTVIQLYTDRNLYERLSQNAVKLSEEVNWENEFQKLIDREKELLA